MWSSLPFERRTTVSGIFIVLFGGVGLIIGACCHQVRRKLLLYESDNVMKPRRVYFPSQFFPVSYFSFLFLLI
jgi:hypothetical protein